MFHHSICGNTEFGPIDSNVSDFTVCFQALIIDSIPLFVFVFGAIAQILALLSANNFDYPSPNRSWTRRFKSQIEVSGSLTLLPIVVLFGRLAISSNSDSPLSVFPFVTIASLLHSIAWGSNTLLLFVLRRHDISANKGIEMWWILSFLSAVKSCESSILRSIHVRSALRSSRLSLKTNCCYKNELQNSDFLPLLFIDVVRCTLVTLMVSNVTTLRQQSISNFDHDGAAISLISPETLNWIDSTIPRRLTAGLLDSRSSDPSEIWNDWLSTAHTNERAASNSRPVGGVKNRINYAHVVSWADVNITASKSSVIQLVVEVGSDSGGSWTVCKRLMEFRWLYDSIISSNGIVDPFPIVESMESFELSRDVINKYLKLALESPALATELDNFLAPPAGMTNIDDKLAYHGASMHVQAGGSPDLIGPMLDKRLGTNAKHDDDRVKDDSPQRVFLPPKQSSTLSDSLREWKDNPNRPKVVTAKVIDVARFGDVEAFQMQVLLSTGQHIIYRRFSQFSSFHDRLANLFGEDMLPQLPSKTFVNRHDDEFLKKRCVQLDIYLQCLVRTALYACPEFIHFLSEDSEYEEQFKSDRGDAEIQIIEAVASTGDGRTTKPFELAPRIDFHRFQAVLTKWILTNLNGKDLVQYALEVREFYTANDYLKWTVIRTYDEFCALQDELRQIVSFECLPRLSRPTLLWSTETEKFASEIAPVLEIFLQVLLGNPYFESRPLNAFLELDNNKRQITTGTRLHASILMPTASQK